MLTCKVVDKPVIVDWSSKVPPLILIVPTATVLAAALDEGFSIKVPPVTLNVVARFCEAAYTKANVPPVPLMVKILKLLPELTVGKVTLIVPDVAVKATVLPVTVKVFVTPGENVPATVIVPDDASVLAPVDDELKLL